MTWGCALFLVVKSERLVAIPTSIGSPFLGDEFIASKVFLRHLHSLATWLKERKGLGTALL